MQAKLFILLLCLASPVQAQQTYNCADLGAVAQFTLMRHIRGQDFAGIVADTIDQIRPSAPDAMVELIALNATQQPRDASEDDQIDFMLRWEDTCRQTRR